MDATVFQAKLAATLKHLEDAAQQAAPASPSSCLVAAAELRQAAVAVDELVRLCLGEPEVRRRDCPSCGKPGMAAARLCGYCWTTSVPVE